MTAAAVHVQVRGEDRWIASCKEHGWTSRATFDDEERAQDWADQHNAGHAHTEAPSTVHYHGSITTEVGTVPLHYTPGNRLVQATSDWSKVTCAACIAERKARTPDAPRGSRTITISRAEFNALIAAAALHGADIEGDPDTDRVRKGQREREALDRIIIKWHEAGRR